MRYRTKRYWGLFEQRVKKDSELARWGFESRRDGILLRRRFPQLKRYPELAAEKRKQILPYYQDYISRVSTEDSTISLELTSFLLVMCDVLKPMRILDLGSGFSSFVIRHYMLSASPKPVVWSTDDTKEWLEKTRSFLNYHNYPSENLVDWLSFSESNEEKFDLVLHDLGDSPESMMVRKVNLKPALSFSKQSGVVVLDDVHMPAYRPYAMSVLNSLRLKHYSLRSLTLDKFGRFSQMVCS